MSAVSVAEKNAESTSRMTMMAIKKPIGAGSLKVRWSPRGS
jgi:hypothetical protein